MGPRVGAQKPRGGNPERPPECAAEIMWIFIAELCGDGFDRQLAREEPFRGKVHAEVSEIGHWTLSAELPEESAEMSDADVSGGGQVRDPTDLRGSGFDERPAAHVGF